MTSNDEVSQRRQQEINIKLCIICMDEDNIVLKKHPCLICDKKAWFCCQECISKLENCPICRTKLNINDDNNQNDNNLDDRNCFEKAVEKYNIFMSNHQTINNILGYIQGIVLTGVIFFYLLYLGKLLIYIFCTSRCDKEKNSQSTKGCECYDLTQVNNYWGDIMHNFGGSLGAGIMGHIVIIMVRKLNCCSSNRRNN